MINRRYFKLTNRHAFLINHIWASLITEPPILKQVIKLIILQESAPSTFWMLIILFNRWRIRWHRLRFKRHINLGNKQTKIILHNSRIQNNILIKSRAITSSMSANRSLLINRRVANRKLLPPRILSWDLRGLISKVLRIVQ